MLNFLSYILAGILTGCDLLYLIVWSTWGGPVHILEFIAAAGAGLLVLAAYVSLSKPRAAAQIALSAALSEWAFYLPAMRTTIAETTAISLHSRAGIFAVLAILFLLIATVRAALIGFRDMPEQVPSRRGRLLACFSTAVIATVMCIGIFFTGREQTAQSFHLVFPDAYRGWARIDFGSPTSPRLPTKNGELVVVVPPSGVVQTSTEMPEGSIMNRYSYVDHHGTVPVARAFCMRQEGTRTKLASEYILVGNQASQTDGHTSGGLSSEGWSEPLN